MTGQGTHAFGAHVWLMIDTGLAFGDPLTVECGYCRAGELHRCVDNRDKPTNSHGVRLRSAAATIDINRGRALLAALGQAMDVAGGITPAARPKAATPAAPHFANRTRSSMNAALPMNPVQHHAASATGRTPSGLIDSAHWTREFERMGNDEDRCEVVRRAAGYLAGLLRTDPEEARKRLKVTDDWLVERILDRQGWDHRAVARETQQSERYVVQLRIGNRRHPLDGRPWQPPDSNVFAASEARAMSAAGMNSTDIAAALGRSAGTVRGWTTGQRRRAA